MSELFAELQESMKADRLEVLWKRFGHIVIMGSVGIVFATAAVVGWNHYTRSQAMQQTALYLKATEALQKNDAPAAIATLESINADPSSAFGGLVLLRKIEAYTRADKSAEASVAQQTLAKQSHVYGDIANLIVATGVDKAASKESPLYFSRSIWQAWQFLDAGKKQEAASVFKAIASNDEAPDALRERAKTVLTQLGNVAPANEVSHEKK